MVILSIMCPFSRAITDRCSPHPAQYIPVCSLKVQVFMWVSSHPINCSFILYIVPFIRIVYSVIPSPSRGRVYIHCSCRMRFRAEPALHWSSGLFIQSYPPPPGGGHIFIVPSVLSSRQN